MALQIRRVVRVRMGDRADKTSISFKCSIKVKRKTLVRTQNRQISLLRVLNWRKMNWGGVFENFSFSTFLDERATIRSIRSVRPPGPVSNRL
jgi:hypothetical protein